MLLGQKSDNSIEVAKQQLKPIPLDKMKRQMQQVRGTIPKREQKDKKQNCPLPWLGNKLKIEWKW